uniref:Uncharacterized protein n=1 Tax=Neogobius melanostomus TaxID=47308 RepID=A0A8C6S7B2_9GOBI
MSAQSAHHHIVGIHVQFLRVQHAQLSVGGLDVVHVLDGPVQSVQHLDAVRQVAIGAKVPLSPGVDDQTPGRALVRIKLALQLKKHRIKNQGPFKFDSEY